MDLLTVIAGLAAHLAGFRGFDYRYSLKFPYYKASEGQRFAQDDFGYLHPVKGWVPFAIMQAVAVAAAVLTARSTYSGWWAFAYMALTAGPGVAHFLQGVLKLSKRLRNDRVQQIKARATRKAMLTGDRDADLLRIAGSLRLRGYAGTDRYAPDFLRWMTVDAPAEEAARLLAPRVLDWLSLPDPDDGDSEDLRVRKLKAIWIDLTFHPKD